MARFLPALVAVLVLMVIALPTPPYRAASSVELGSADLTSVKTRFEEAYGKLPLHFEANRGQTDEQVRFLARASGYALFLTPSEAVLSVRSAASPMTSGGAEQAQAAGTVLRMQLVGANPQPQVTGGEELPGRVNYFMGNDPAKWLGNIPTYGKVHYQEVYPGIDLVFYGNQRQLEYDFIVAPGTDPGAIRLSLAGADLLEVDAEGDLVVQIADGDLRLKKPFIYQEVDGERREIFGDYTLIDTRQVGFQVGPYDAARPLVIDPVLVYSTFLGGSAGDIGRDIALDAAGNAYVTGETSSASFPTTAGAFDTSFNASVDAFVTKLNSTGTALVYSTFLGGTAAPSDEGRGIALDAAGNAYVTGQAGSADFPTTAGAFDTSFDGGPNDAFVTKLDPTGSVLVYSTFLGGVGNDLGNSIAVDGAANGYVTGWTGSADFPTTAGAFDTSHNLGRDVFITKLSSTGTALVYSTFLGGTSADEGNGIALDAAANAYVTGQAGSAFPTTAGAFDSSHNGFTDAFVTKLDSTGSVLVYSTFLGGSLGFFEFGNSIALDAAGDAYVTGLTTAPDFPTTAGAFDTSHNGGNDAFIARLNSTGAALVYSTFLGSTGSDFGRGIALDAAGSAYVTGETSSASFPTTAGAFDTSFNGSADTFVTKVNPTGTALVYSTFLGGTSGEVGNGITVDAGGNAYVTGQTSSANFPTTAGAFDVSFASPFDAFVAKLDTSAAVPATVVLTPAADTNQVDSTHTVTATVQDAGGNPVPGITVRFSVTGAVTTSGSCVTNASGQCSFTYSGPALPGVDAITAFADTNNNSAQDIGEPSGAATKAWVLPPSTVGCTTTIFGVRITAANGDKATAGGNAKVSQSGVPKGQQTYRDHGPAQPLLVKSDNVLAVVCVAISGGKESTIFGQATVDGSGTVNYRIRVKDLGEPGKGNDTYGILLSNGYFSGEQTLEGGNVEIKTD